MITACMPVPYMQYILKVMVIPDSCRKPQLYSPKAGRSGGKQGHCLESMTLWYLGIIIHAACTIYIE